MILFKLLKKYIVYKMGSKSEHQYFQIFLTILCVTFVLYWLNPNSRTAHFSRAGTIESTAIKFLLPISVFVFCLSFTYLTLVLSSRARRNFLRNFEVGKHTPSVFFLAFVVFPYFLAYAGNSLVSDFYYRLFRVSNIEPTFADLRTILYGISCKDVVELGDVITCDPRGATTIWNYPTILLSLRSLGVGINHLFILALILTVIIIMASFLISRTLESRGRILFSLIIFSPPVLLCFDRMNFDLVITSLVIIAAKLVTNSQKHLLALPTALILLSSAAILKFYALPVLIIVTLYSLKKNQNPLLSLTVCVATSAVIASDLSSLSEFVGTDVRGSVGLNVLTSLLNGSPSASIHLLSTGFILALIFTCSLLLLYILNNLRFPSIPNNDLTSILLTVLFLIPWFTTSSYYYRMVILVFILPFFVKSNSRKIERGTLTLAVCSLYLSPVSLAIVQNIFLVPFISMQVIGLFLVLFPFEFRQKSVRYG